jgi:BlaI family transcriptional regulator, penicillinase repressor
MARRSPLDVGRRERQIMDVVYRLGEASVAEVRAHLADPPSYSAVRAMLAILERKGLLKHRQEKLRFVYLPAVPAERARKDALATVMRNFFGGSPIEVVAALLDPRSCDLSENELAELASLVDRARKEGR